MNIIYKVQIWQASLLFIDKVLAVNPGYAEEDSHKKHRMNMSKDTHAVEGLKKYQSAREIIYLLQIH